jgi:asparagine synthase (glutamine-hydrolysing)
VTATGFFVLPDSPAAQRLARRVATGSMVVVAHASGRPWLVAGANSRLTVASAGGVRLVVLGTCPVTDERLRELAARPRTVAGLGPVFEALAGSDFLLASVDGDAGMQGGVSGLSVLYHSTVDGVPVAADRADALAALAGADVDEEALALRVVCGPQLPGPAGDRPMWSRVSSLPPGHRLLWNRDGVRVTEFWRPPSADLSLAAAACGVRAALTAATRPRPAAAGRLSTDLSGGLDSTSLAFLVAPHTRDLLTFRWGEAEAGNDDAVFAGLAIRALSGAQHLVLSPAQSPRTFSDIASFADLEQPHPITRTLGRVRHAARHLVAHGSRRHLAGHGGDELFVPLHGYLHRLLRRRPVTGLRTVRAYAALQRWPLLPSLAAAARPGNPAAWWRAQADRLTDPLPPLRRPVLGWGVGWLRAAGWVTGDAVDLCRAGLRRAAETARPLADDPGVHQLLLLLRTNAVHYRLLGRIYAEAGTDLELPYYDDRVLGAVLRVPQAEHAGPWRYKPLLAAAMRDTVPAPLLGRATKGEFSEDLRTGLRANLSAILGLLADSALAARGLIDPDRLRALVTGPQQDNRTVIALESLLGCEVWLRAATTFSATPRRHPDAAEATVRGG